MGYYVRILSPSKKIASIAKIKAALAREKLPVVLTVESGASDNWSQVILSQRGGEAIASIERNDASSDDLVLEEIEEFLEEISDCKPASSVAWLADYLPTVKTIYALQILSGVNARDGWQIFDEVKSSIFNQVGGVIQADGEGFTDLDGYHILWQFSNSVDGKWWMGILEDDEWVHFEMDLGNKQHRAAFLRGEVPKGVKLVE